MPAFCNAKKKKKDWKPPNKGVLTTEMEAVMFAELKKKKKDWIM